ncbi:12S rRNA N4-methylcytidine (m4C) methyltransferase isoform X5 [Prionailurus viverrinus]|uniref:12S rRNA N4-methylcytidine (m4C) methyltransferase isoform X5 n=1 Tax=Prionailurus viverrinus TaxID=61388 RepID=UPI001FF148AE|nr:12S rRNA N4-methylcytidine (m4C) methyltransferase isoform X5 [Prionailurus viverrinus]
MLRYPYFCKIYKEFHSCWLESGIFNLGIWPKKIHATTERCNEYEAEEQTDQTGAQELHRSQNGDFEAMTKLHIPVMVDEVVRCLAPQKGQGYMISCKNVNGETKFFQMSFLIRFYRTTLYLCLHYLCPGRLTFPGQIIWLPCPVASGWITQMGVTSWRSESEIFLDMTFGSGGHTRAILQKESDITLYALDRDPTAYAIAEQLSEFYPKQIRAMLGQFSQAEALLMKAGVQPGTLDGVLLDLGCSSMQLDAPERGFSLRKDGPLDMRMDGGRSTGTCLHPENIRGGEACQENRFSNRSGSQPLPHLQNPAACQHRCRCISSICYFCTKRLATTIYPYCYQDFPSFSNICK